MPAALNEPVNLLQRLCEELEYSELLDTANNTSDPYQRMVRPLKHTHTHTHTHFTQCKMQCNLKQQMIALMNLTIFTLLELHSYNPFTFLTVHTKG